MADYLVVRVQGYTDDMFRRYGNSEQAIDFNKIIKLPSASLDLPDGGNQADLESLYALKQKQQGKPLTFIPIKQGIDVKAVEAKYKQTCNAYESLYANGDNSKSTLYMLGIFKKYPTAYSLGKAYVTNRIKYGVATIYDWCVKNWGTKWNASEVKYDAERKYLEFVVPYTVPMPILKKLAYENKRAVMDIEVELEGTGIKYYYKVEKGVVCKVG